MRILLPPSEGKTLPASGPALDLSVLAHSALTEARAAVVDELIEVSQRADALEILKAGERIRPEVEAQCNLWNLPCAPAREVYTGVLYEAAQLRKGDDVTIFSVLFGATGGEDLIPAYRLSMNVKLPRADALKTYWRRQWRHVGRACRGCQPGAERRGHPYGRRVCRRWRQWRDGLGQYRISGVDKRRQFNWAAGAVGRRRRRQWRWRHRR